MKAGICAQPARVLSPAAQLVPYIRTARGRPASRRIPSPPECLPRVTLRRLAVNGMGENLHDGAPRLSGMWVRLPEAFAWVATRDSAFATEQSDVTRNRLKLGLIFHSGGTDGSVFQRSEAALLSALRRAEVGAKGRPGNMQNAQGPHSDIPSYQWALMRFGENGEFFRVETEQGVGDAEFWHDVIVQADQLVKAFPAPVLPAAEDENGVANIIAPVAQLKADGGNNASTNTSADAHCNTVARPDALQGALPQTVALGPPRPAARQVIDAILNTWKQGGSQSALQPRKVATLKVASNRSGETRAACEEAWDISVKRFPGTAWKQGRPKA